MKQRRYSEIGPEVTLRPLATSCAKDYKGHSLVQTSFTEPPNSYLFLVPLSFGFKFLDGFVQRVHRGPWDHCGGHTFKYKATAAKRKFRQGLWTYSAWKISTQVKLQQQQYFTIITQVLYNAKPRGKMRNLTALYIIINGTKKQSLKSLTWKSNTNTYSNTWIIIRSGDLPTQKLMSFLLRTQSFPYNAWSRSEYSHACFVYSQEFLPCLNFHLLGLVTFICSKSSP